ncbi:MULTISPECIES: alkaline phosphatase [Brucella/Ochrobactrum group]|uniref:Alkaline phosphatase n=1 Tax=Ochrobactrum soli TaxID=2448455 RepID=A0A2P9HFC8_9HYPH|nr:MULTISPECIES: alkaline phosphatase [Brucella]MCI0998832.1 alkaline phosphatase [Ochrobactrum sp. C6C9]RRD26903.1 alkaline phosphatase [Brucellaceae bacterium VT-16-1752]WHT43562.1 alkaline phosphatase [Ochrobactrum sp. SSR]MDX4072990.1 alkaline phosphatase [Brucella sp. NBRC 113783]WHS33462.1 alkaline phosphatase [Brucella sp. NM4]
MRKLLLALASATILSGAANAADIYPLDRATILVGSPFDFKVELDKVVKPEEVKVTVNGKDYETVFGAKAEFVAEEKGSEDKVLGSALILRDLKIAEPGAYKVEISAGDETKAVTWDVYPTATEAKAKNIIFLVADGLSVAHRTGARIMSKGMAGGKANGRLNMDDVPPVAFIGTSSTHSIATDSANTMSAYMTGHKARVNALGVYADRTPASQDDPKVETIGEALRRQTKKSIGIVSTSEVEDATPAALVSHTRKRSDKADIVGMFYDVRPDVLLGGGSAYFLSKDVPGSKRKDDKDYIQLFRDAGYAIVTDKNELAASGQSNQQNLLGLFHTGNMDVTLDRDFLKKGTVDKFPNQPGLVDMTKAALDKLSKNPDGFFLMVEGASIDKMSHPLDWERALVDTIEFDKAVGVAQEFAKNNPDTLIVVTGDHTHGVAIIGTVDDDKPGDEMRAKVGTYDAAGFPNYEDKDGDGYPDRVDVSRRLFMAANNGPDHYETFRPKLDDPFVPAIKNEKGEYVANEAYKDVPGAVFVQGNIPKDEDTGVHAVDDIVLQATGPGSEGLRGYMEQSDVYRVLADAFALGKPKSE